MFTLEEMVVGFFCLFCFVLNETNGQVQTLHLLRTRETRSCFCSSSFLVCFSLVNIFCLCSLLFNLGSAIKEIRNSLDFSYSTLVTSQQPRKKLTNTIIIFYFFCWRKWRLEVVRIRFEICTELVTRPCTSRYRSEYQGCADRRRLGSRCLQRAYYEGKP